MCMAECSILLRSCDCFRWYLQFGMFVHWGVYSVLQRGEWIQHLVRHTDTIALNGLFSEDKVRRVESAKRTMKPSLINLIL